MTAQELVNQGYGGYAGWGDAEAEANFNATGGAGKQTGGGSSGGGSSSVDDILNNAISSFTAYLPKSVKPYEEVNPFFFDEVLARQAAEAEYAPYYDEMLSDYVTGVERTKSRSDSDFKRTLESLDAGKEYYMGTQRRLLDRAVKNVNEGYSGRGLFFAGAKDKDIGEMKTEYEAEKSNYMRNYEYQKSGAELAKQRLYEDVDLDQSKFTRDTERERKYAIEGGVLKRRSEAQEEYEAGRQKYYDNASYNGLTGAYA
jgi:hypothetical protein